MHFGAVRTDSERIEKALHQNSSIDNKPTLPEHLNWRMRSRQRTKQIGPEFKFNSHLQMERVLDTIRAKTGY